MKDTEIVPHKERRWSPQGPPGSGHVYLLEEASLDPHLPNIASAPLAAIPPKHSFPSHLPNPSLGSHLMGDSTLVSLPPVPPSIHLLSTTGEIEFAAYYSHIKGV